MQSSISIAANKSDDRSDDIVAQCQHASSSKVKYSICLDEKLKKAELFYKAWVQGRELELDELVKQTGRDSILSEFIKANKFYEQFMESQCRRVFFENQSEGNAADQYRVCKVNQYNARIKQLKAEAK
ncbi:hypothetical protein [Algibacillus agarilyticus]|uniref:hypothetical protein n=1 Tax=Algibacillus agarilyticus TaxID=2234133 RepID=UPI001E5DEFF8|nr:hypothetical protein [Algibacillus agarilyticus]